MCKLFCINCKNKERTYVRAFLIIIRMAQTSVEPLDLTAEVIEADICVIDS